MVSIKCGKNCDVAFQYVFDPDTPDARKTAFRSIMAHRAECLNFEVRCPPIVLFLTLTFL